MGRHNSQTALFVGAGALILGLLVAGRAFLPWYLAAAVLVSAVPAGCLALIFVHRLTGGVWGETLAPSLVAAVRTLPLGALLLLPAVFGQDVLYPWVFDPTDDVVHRYWLNVWSFGARSVIYFTVWIGLGRLALRPGGPSRGMAAVGLVLYAVTASFAGFDWLMSLEPRFHSSIFGMIFLAHQIIAGLAFATAATLARQGSTMPLSGLGALLLSGAMAWAYIAFTQYLVIWQGDLPHNAEWYLRRAEGGWRAVLWSVVALQGLLPMILLSDRLRRNARVLLWVGGAVLLGRALETLWLAVPAVEPADRADWPVGLLAVIGAAALWIGVYWRAETGAAQTRSVERPAGRAALTPRRAK